MRIEIPKQVEWILERLRAQGYEAFAVGGCVRDTLLGREPGDWDITTSARPEQVKAVFGHTIDTGLKHGTVTVMRDHVGYEITTYRIDGEYEDGRHPKEVSFTGDLREDLRRRDFTINAMAYSHETGIVDVFGGMEDLKSGTLRCVGNAMERFTEDALRILRAVRFSAQLNFRIEEETWQALYQIAPNLAQVSKERIQVELTKTLLSDHPERIFMVEETGMSPFLCDSFPEAIRGAAGRKEQLLRASSLPAEKSLRFAAFLSGGGERLAGKVLKELKLDNETISRVKLLTGLFDRELEEEETSLRRLMSPLEAELFDGLVLLRRTLKPEEEELIGRIDRVAAAIRSRGDCIRLKDLAVTGRDLMAAGIQPGPQLGKQLNRLLQHVLAAPQDNQKELLLALIEK